MIAERYQRFLNMAEDVAEGLRPNKDLSGAIDQEREFLEGDDHEEE